MMVTFLVKIDVFEDISKGIKTEKAEGEEESEVCCIQFCVQIYNFKLRW